MAPPPVPPAKRVGTPAKKPESKVSGRVANVEGSPVASKSASRAGSVASSLKRTGTPDEVRDDVSVAESSRGHRKTEEERLQFFRDQPDCREVEPHRAFCTACDQWVLLNPTRTYVMRPWLNHRRECRRASAEKPASTVSPPKEVDHGDSSGEDDDKSSYLQSTSEQSARGKTEAERQAYLEADPRADEVRPYEVLCKTCQKWVQLGNKHRYSLSNWKAHQKACSGSIPSSRVATAERKLKLVNDASAKSFTTKSVCCKCDTTVKLEGEGQYNLTKWEEHKAGCLRSVYLIPSSQILIRSERCSVSEDEPAVEPMDVTDAAAAEVPASLEKLEDRPPLSVASTDATAVDAPVPPGQGTKRPREVDEDEPEERPRTRPRTQLEQPTSALNWLLLPFRSFISGFKQGMQQPSSSSPSESTPT
ncbi:hypothetical protein BC834DRAFT_921926 [Gloeopeniophorella convolvens]|nr:hypothetical protein BC834DRAFT_921926 [Gloeopeniophorella convolvens]